ncbi:hypothetical protein LMTR13_09355 [Bradyrhizobium icense]|uniref:Uncharacterized protein n=2 Tax=Bradyrhizobium icense TaxID=1274631 RepID=A0A1B1URP6_9BRAD|nr:hypothetical protein LMTR13_09355 [Bradyrhizobium icense]
MSILTGVLLFLPAAAMAQPERLFKLSDSQNISCSRNLSRGKLRTATCTTFTYLFNTRTSEYFRCQMSLAATRDKREVLIVLTDGGCAKQQRVFSAESSYDFDATETEPTNMNSFFGHGGHSVWVADTTRRKMRGCITISSEIGSNVSKCLDMKFE